MLKEVVLNVYTEKYAEGNRQKLKGGIWGTGGLESWHTAVLTDTQWILL